MIFHRLGLIKNQSGFTLIEIILAIAITGIIVGGITMTIFQVFSVNARSSNHMVAVRQVQNAGYWVSSDALMAQNVELDSDGFLLLSWSDRETNVHNVQYTLVGGELKRTENDETTMVAKFIDPTKTECQFVDTDEDGTGDKLIFKVTATVDKESETRMYQVSPRPTPEKK